jgi:hypothetical protein
MKIWLFQDVRVSKDSYHPFGGLVVVAETEGHVKQLITRYNGVTLDDEDWENVRTFPTHSYVPPEVFIFPEAGCC